MEQNHTNKAIDFEKIIEEAQENPSKFFMEIKARYSKQELNRLFGYFLANSKNYKLLYETIKFIFYMNDEINSDILIDFIMRENFEELPQNLATELKTLCIKSLSNSKSKKAIPALLYCLNDKKANYKMRFLAAEALGKIGDNNAVESLINVVSDENEKSIYVRESAALALGMIGDMRAVDPFLNILETKSGILSKFTFLKERILEALVKINFLKSDRLISALKSSLEDDSAQVRINAIEGLMNSGDPNTYEIIKTKIYDTDPEVIKNAVIAMYNLKGKEALFEILKDEKTPNEAKKEADKLYVEYEEE